MLCNKMQQGKISFEKILTASSLPPYSQLILPAQFVQQHGDKIYETVTLRNGASGKTWTVKINILFPQKRPQTLFSSGWKAFAVANDLALGDRLTFVLEAKSLFDVFVLRSCGNPALSVQTPKIWSQDLLSVRRETKMSLGPQHGCDISANGSEESKITRNGTSFSKATAEKTYATAFASEVPDSSQSPSDVDSHCFGLMIQQEKQECIICQIAAMTQLDTIKVQAGYHTS